MSETIKILRNSKRSVDSVDVERSVSVDMQHTVSPLGDKDIQATIDLNEQYLKERNACNDYRLIVTIKPYCTNVLFNACTEAVINEGSNDTDVVLPYDNIDQSTLVKIKNKIKGKDNNVGIYDMIRNTEYSREGIGFDYHPGLDIFNNHILRNKTYRIVNDYVKADNKEIFNTISDYMRSSDGSILKRCCRKNIDDISMVDKHLYDKDDILPFYTGDAVKENLREQDGWFGFYNTSVISAKNKGGVDMDISRVINSKGNCEFIDMYPDRTLFSFIPKYNPHRNRLEYNWDYAITYAFDSTTQYSVNESGTHTLKDFELIKDGDVNALLTLSVEYRLLPNGRGAVFFRSAVKHNLKVNDKVYIYFDENEDGADWHKSCNTYLVAGVGDINHKEQDYYFYVTDLTILEEIFCTPYLCDINPGQVNHTYGAWNYVRDYFYAEYDPDQIPNFNSEKTTKVNQIVSYGGQRWIANQEHKGDWDSSHFDLFDPTTYDDYVVEYPDEVEIDGKFEGGLTNIPSENDWFIKVKDVGEPSKYFILFNHDRDIQYDGSTSSALFIQAIINNAFTNKDVYPDTNPNNKIDSDTNTEVNPNMNGIFSDYISIRFAKTNGMYDCSYYVRKFKQVPDPNIVFERTIICTDASNTPEGVCWIVDNTDPDNPVTITGTHQASANTLNELYLVPRITEDGTPEYSQYITVQSLVKRNNGEVIDYRWERRAMTLDNETYQLAFSKTIYNDNISQTTFTDDLNVMGLKDNLGRNLSEVFLTIVKANRGYKKWYNYYDTDNDGIDEESENPEDTDTSVYNDPDIEYSHCFGPVTCGFDISKEYDDSANIREARAELMDVTMINPNATMSTIPNDEQYDGFSTKDIEVADNWFYGDIVEYCPWTCEETTLSDVCFRFNTAQRELNIDSPGSDPIFKFDEISRDDYDTNGFKVCTYGVTNIANRDEGYYYKAHYRIPLKALGPIKQSSHPYISVAEASPIQVDGMYILVRTALRHNLNNESKVLLRDTTVSGGNEWWLDVVYIVDDYSFVMNIIPRTDPNYRDWVSICQFLNNRQYTLRAKNPDIPERASRLGVNTFLWRDTADILDISSLDSDINSYVFANNAIYVDTSFNFYLKRQDPYKVNGLYYDGTKAIINPVSGSGGQDCEGLNSIDKWFLGDIESKADRFESRYEYNDTEYEAQC